MYIISCLKNHTIRFIWCLLKRDFIVQQSTATTRPLVYYTKQIIQRILQYSCKTSQRVHLDFTTTLCFSFGSFFLQISTTQTIKELKEQHQQQHSMSKNKEMSYIYTYIRTYDTAQQSSFRQLFAPLNPARSTQAITHDTVVRFVPSYDH